MTLLPAPFIISTITYFKAMNLTNSTIQTAIHILISTIHTIMQPKRVKRINYVKGYDMLTAIMKVKYHCA